MISEIQYVYYDYFFFFYEHFKFKNRINILFCLLFIINRIMQESFLIIIIETNDGDKFEFTSLLDLLQGYTKIRKKLHFIGKYVLF